MLPYLSSYAGFIAKIFCNSNVSIFVTYCSNCCKQYEYNCQNYERFYI